ncbi:TPA: hypothetical protein ACXDAY_002276 [Clostridium botulinum]|uniref:hypothetical protein n=1 Tax=Clostridium botulinum TaxID=1491 RepID=UPI00046588C4|nr:hypothetical protein [Clostridium botulinum]APH21068.1 hypothetical protein NPD1_4099 [Clostridium botulinum]APQ71261.1 hypothetical protein RSJ8_4335 [Clostridium botulinum]APR02402.1 hypothetical protein RSJ2_4196 [Clostridium botulinum]AUN01436.1 hypothetical protein RSJ19_00195 [Clostridium botulinum]MBN3359163.1 hypothetical protein [Clostridium botulinum]
MNKTLKLKQFNNKIYLYNRKNPVTVGKEIKIIFHDAIVFSGQVTKENISEIQKMITYSDNYIIN